MIIFLSFLQIALSQLSTQALGLPDSYAGTLAVCARTGVSNVTSAQQSAGLSLLKSLPTFKYNPVSAVLFQG
jgi:hypothetical protein